MRDGSVPLNLRDAVLPITVVVAIIGGALVIQSRMLAVEFAVDGLKQYIALRADANAERLRMFATTLKSLNPELKIPEVPK